MVKLLSADDVAAILKVSKRTAYNLMLDMPHLEKPRRVSEWALTDWLNSKTVEPKKRKKEKKQYYRPTTVLPYRKAEV